MTSALRQTLVRSNLVFYRITDRCVRMEEGADPPDRGAIGSTYNRIAPHFAQTRQAPWPEVESFVRDAGDVNRALDLGCGNGRHLALLGEVASDVIGIDLSRTLLRIARNHDTEAQTVQADVVTLPLQTDSIDLAVYIATLHHLPTPAERQESLGEVVRVLQPGGKACISCWSVSHDKFDATTGHDRWVDWTLPSGEVVPRFYHIFDLAEFTAMLEASTLTIESTFESAGNCFGIVRAPH